MCYNREAVAFKLPAGWHAVIQSSVSGTHILQRKYYSVSISSTGQRLDMTGKDGSQQGSSFHINSYRELYAFLIAIKQWDLALQDIITEQDKWNTSL